MEKEFVKTITDHQGIIHKVCRLYCEDEDDSEDLFQEIILQLWRSYPTFNKLSLVSTWMYKVALNTAITRLRKLNGKKNHQRLAPELYNMPEEAGNAYDQEKTQDLYNAITHLDKFDKAIVILYLEDNSYKDMAEILGISESYLGVKINRIKKKLKEILNP